MPRLALGRLVVAGSLAAGCAGLLCAPTAASAASVSVPSVSGNWAGYVATGSNITSVQGEWTVPNGGSLPPGLSSTWTGIGGFNTTDLIQAGTQQASSPYDQVFAGGTYAAWYELLPANPVYLTGCSGNAACTVSPGDTMEVTISNVSGDQWSIDVADLGHWTYSTTVTYASSKSSAEWIHEAPSAAGAVPVPVGNSGTVTFDGANSAVINGVSHDIAGSGATATVALPVETTTSALDSDGEGFNVCTYSLSCSPSAS
ncbi:MAG TPA: hypothetical protein VE990_11920 [Acidimicrobiales bacterium]|nr:hypothetical protein [Acidimicrobiales bacterium]